VETGLHALVEVDTSSSRCVLPRPCWF